MLIQEILTEIRRDIASFADPGTEVQIAGSTLTWTRDRREVAVNLLVSSGFPDVRVGGRTYSYEAFLASETLADLRDLAQGILTQVAEPDHFVAGEMRFGENGEMPEKVSDPAAFLELVAGRTGRPLAATRVVFLHGNAGIGKTSLLTHLTRLQAKRYLEGQSSTLLLYLDAQGKGLSQLEDVMARALQDLRARFTYHSVAPLTRRCCLIPIVDGFDELIGPSSAGEAFANLSQFLAQLDRTGALVASSRSAFIDYATLHQRASEVAARGLSYEIAPVEVLPWKDEAIRQLCELRAGSHVGVVGAITALLETPVGGMIRKPFFLTQVLAILLGGGRVDRDADLVSQVVDAALQREAGKLAARGVPLLTAVQHRRFCELLAEEMWAEQRTDLDVESIRVLAELAADEFGLAARDAKLLIDRAHAHGLLTKTVSGYVEKRSFEHEVFRFEFLAGTLAKLVTAGDESALDFLQGGELPREVADRLPGFLPKGLAQVRAAIASVGVVRRDRTRNANVSPNAAAMTAALIRSAGAALEDLMLNGLHFRSDSLAGTRLLRATMRECVLEQVDLSNAWLEQCEIFDTQFIKCVLDGKTRLTGTKVELEAFIGVGRPEGRTVHEVFDSREILGILQSAGAGVEAPSGVASDGGAAGPSPETERRIHLAETLLRHGKTHFYMSREEPWFKKQIGGDREWRVVEELMKEHGLLGEVKLVKSGRPEAFLRLTVPPDKILAGRVRSKTGIDSRAGAFWRALGA